MLYGISYSILRGRIKGTACAARGHIALRNVQRQWDFLCYMEYHIAQEVSYSTGSIIIIVHGDK